MNGENEINLRLRKDPSYRQMFVDQLDVRTCWQSRSLVEICRTMHRDRDPSSKPYFG